MFDTNPKLRALKVWIPSLRSLDQLLFTSSASIYRDIKAMNILLANVLMEFAHKGPSEGNLFTRCAVQVTKVTLER